MTRAGGDTYTNHPTYALVAWAAPDAAYRVVEAALQQMRAYTDAARTQMERIDSGLQAAQVAFTRIDAGPESFAERRSEAFDVLAQVHVEVGFYLSCWRSVTQTIELVEQRSGLETRVSESDRQLLRDYAEAQEHIQTFDPGRLPVVRGGPTTPPGYLGRITSRTPPTARTYSYGDREWDISPASVSELQRIVSEFDNGLRAEVLPRFLRWQNKGKAEGARGT